MFKPFENGTESASIADLTLENQLDYVSVYGNLQISKDQAGLATAKTLQAFINAVVLALESEPLPERIAQQKTQRIDNPFL